MAHYWSTRAPVEQRQRDGEVPNALVVDRNVLEWRLDPSSPHRIDAVTGYDQAIVVMCNEGYASSLVAAQLQDMGLARRHRRRRRLPGVACRGPADHARYSGRLTPRSAETRATTSGNTFFIRNRSRAML